MKKQTFLRALSLLLVLASVICVPMAFSSSAETASEEEGELDNAYEALYVQDVDGDGKSDIRFFYDAYGKTSEDTVGSNITDRLGNTLSVASGASYTKDALYLNGKILNLTPFYSKADDIYLELVLAQTGKKNWSASSYIGPTKTIQIQQNTPVDESYGVVSGTYWSGKRLGGNTATLQIGTDCDWKTTHFLGAPAGQIFTVGFAVDKDLTAEEPFYNLSYVRDCVTVAKAPAPALYTESDDGSIKFGEAFAVNYHAIRLYSKVLSDIQIKQNHFADLAAYTKMDLTAFYALAEDEREVLYSLTADLAFGDPDLSEKLETALEETFIGALYVRDVDGDGETDATLLWNAFDKTAGDPVSETAFKTSASATYGDGFLYNNEAEINLTSYLPNIAYGSQTAQKDYSIEMVMSTHAPYASGTGMSVSGKTWFFGNFSAAFYFRQSEHADYLAGNGPISVYVGKLGDTNLNFNFNKGKKNFWLGTEPLEVYTSTGVFDLTLGTEPDKTKDTIQMGFYRNAEKLSINTATNNPVPYDASNANDKLTIGLGMRMNFYAIRVYAAALSVDDMNQNHLADLVSYYRPENIGFLTELSPLGMKTVRDACASLKLGAEGTESALKKAINEVYESEKGEIWLGDLFLDFVGYSMRMAGARDLRVTYAVDLDYIADLPEYAEVLEIGLLRTDVGAAYGNQKMKKDGLTLSYVSKNAHADKTVFYEAKEGEALAANYSAVFNCTDSTAEQMVRGYVTINLRGEEVTLYEDAESPTFGTTVSLVRLSAALYGKNAYEIPDLAPEAVLEGVLEGAEGIFDGLEEEVKAAEDARVGAFEKIATAKASANKLKEDLKEIALAGVGATSEKQTELKAQAVALLAGVASIKADGEITHPNLGDAMSLLSAEADRQAALVVLAAEALGVDGDIADRAAQLAAAAVSEEEAQKAGFSKEALRQKTDVTDALKVAEKIGARIEKGEFGEVKTFKVLAIGNSFSNNAMSQLYEIAASFGYEDIVLGNLYIGGCSIEKHYNNAKNNQAAYDYKKATSTSWRTYSDSTILDGLKDEDWDIITIQQVSHLAPKKSSLTDGKLDYLSDYVAANKTNKDAKFYYHATWAYATDHEHPNGSKAGYEYLNDQVEMDALIAEGVRDAILTRDDIDGVIYAGVSVAEARRHFGDAVASEKTLYTNPDGYHLSARGCYVIGLTWFGTLTGEDVSKATDVKNSFKGNPGDLDAAIEAAKVGIAAAK